MVGLGDRVRTEVDVDEEMNEDLTLDPERALKTTPVVYLGEASRASASVNHALLRTRPERRGCHCDVPRAGSLSLGF